MRNKLASSLFSLAAVCVVLVWIFYLQNPRLLEKLSVHPLKWNQFYTAFTGVWLHSNLDHLFGNLIALISLSIIFMLLFPSLWLHFFVNQYVGSSIIFFSLPRKIHNILVLLFGSIHLFHLS